MTTLHAFVPNPAGTIALTGGSASVQANLTGGSALTPGERQLLITNTASGTAPVPYIRLGGTATVALVAGTGTFGDTPVPGGTTLCFSVPDSITTVSMITAGGTATVYLTQGIGVKP